MLRLRRKNVVGLDIDASAVRMVQLRKDNAGCVVIKAGVTDIAPWGNDPQLRKIHTVRAIVDGLSSCGISSKFAVCGLRGPEVVVRGFEFPALPPEEIEGAVQLEVSQICPFLAEESTFDYQVTSSDDKSTMGFWVAATNGLIEGTRQLVSDAGLHCALVDVTGLALLNLLQSSRRMGLAPPQPAAQEEPVGQAPPYNSPESELPQPQWNRPAVLNLSDSCATIAIADPAGRPFVRDIGGGALVDSRRSLAAARGGIHGSFSAEDGWAARNDYRSVTNDSLLEDVTTTLRYYAAQNGTMRVDRLLVCGGFAAEESMELLRMRLNVEVEPWNPLTDCGFRMDDGGLEEPTDTSPPSAIRDPQLCGPSLAAAAGLAMRHV